MKFLLDTNICIYVIKRKPLETLARFKRHQPTDILISSITVAELEYGVAKSQQPEKNRNALQDFLLTLEVLEFNQRDAQVYGELRAYLERQGQIIGSLDLLIAAQAISNNLILVSNNTKEFIRIPHLQLENWVDQ